MHLKINVILKFLFVFCKEKGKTNKEGYRQEKIIEETKQVKEIVPKLESRELQKILINFKIVRLFLEIFAYFKKNHKIDIFVILENCARFKIIIMNFLQITTDFEKRDEFLEIKNKRGVRESKERMEKSRDKLE